LFAFFGKVIIFVLILIVSVGICAVSADSVCSKCGFKNSDKDRYCLECISELRAVTKEEKIQLKKEDHEISLRKRKPLRLKGNLSDKISTIVKDGEDVNLKEHAVKGSVTVFDFYADWCGPCKNLTPKLEEFVKKNKNVYLRKINIKTWGSAVSKKYSIKSIPSIWIYDKNKKCIAKSINGMHKIKKTVQKALSE